MENTKGRSPEEILLFFWILSKLLRYNDTFLGEIHPFDYPICKHSGHFSTPLDQILINII